MFFSLQIQIHILLDYETSNRMWISSSLLLFNGNVDKKIGFKLENLKSDLKKTTT